MNAISTTRRPASTSQRFALVRAGRFELAIDALLVEQVVRGPFALTPFPRTPRHVLGAFEWRGIAMPMLDLARLLAPDGLSTATDGMREADFNSASRAVVVRHATGRFALPIDELRELVVASPESITTLDRNATVHSQNGAAEASLFTRLYTSPTSGRISVVLDTDAILGIDNLRSAMDEASAGSKGSTREVDARRYVTVHAGTARFAVEAGAVRQVERYLGDGIAAFGHPTLRGFHRFRDHDLAVVDLLALLALPPTSSSATARRHLLIIGRTEEESVGLIVDGIESIGRIPTSTIEAVHHNGLHLEEAYAGRTIDASGRAVFILDAPQLLRAANVVDRAVLLRSAASATSAESSDASPRRQYVVYRAGGGALASPIGDVLAVVSFPTVFDDLRQPGSPLVGVMTHLGRGIGVLDLGALMGAAPLDDVVGRPVLVVETDTGVHGLLLESLAFLRVATPSPIPIPRKTGMGALPPFRQMIRARAEGTDRSAAVLELREIDVPAFDPTTVARHDGLAA